LSFEVPDVRIIVKNGVRNAQRCEKPFQHIHQLPVLSFLLRILACDCLCFHLVEIVSMRLIETCMLVNVQFTWVCEHESFLRTASRTEIGRPVLYGGQKVEAFPQREVQKLH